MRLVDFNPIGGATSPLLFSWDELKYCSLETEDNGERREIRAGVLSSSRSEAEPEGKLSPFIEKDYPMKKNPYASFLSQGQFLRITSY